MTLEELYADDELERIQFDLGASADLIDGLLEGEDIDPDLVRYAAMALFSLAQRVESGG